MNIKYAIALAALLPFGTAQADDSASLTWIPESAAPGSLFKVVPKFEEPGRFSIDVISKNGRKDYVGTLVLNPHGMIDERLELVPDGKIPGRFYINGYPPSGKKNFEATISTIVTSNSVKFEIKPERGGEVQVAQHSSQKNIFAINVFDAQKRKTYWADLKVIAEGEGRMEVVKSATTAGQFALNLLNQNNKQFAATISIAPFN